MEAYFIINWKHFLFNATFPVRLSFKKKIIVIFPKLCSINFFFNYKKFFLTSDFKSAFVPSIHFKEFLANIPIWTVGGESQWKGLNFEKKLEKNFTRKAPRALRDWKTIAKGLQVENIVKNNVFKNVTKFTNIFWKFELSLRLRNHFWSFWIIQIIF
jgi:hypothetical protein